MKKRVFHIRIVEDLLFVTVSSSPICGRDELTCPSSGRWFAWVYAGRGGPFMVYKRRDQGLRCNANEMCRLQKTLELYSREV